MEIHGTSKPGYEHKLVFEELDQDVVMAMELERIEMAAEKNDGIDEPIELGEGDTRWRWVKNRRGLWESGKQLWVSDLESVASQFQQFYDRTAEAIVEIPHVTGVPAFKNEEIRERRNLGLHALRLANQLRSHSLESIVTKGFDDLDEEASLLFENPPLSD
jgi:hypothetical protein